MSLDATDSPVAGGAEPVDSAAASGHWTWLEPVAFGLCALAVLYYLFLRLGQIPTGLFADQTFMGWEGRCLDKTLADHEGTLLPAYFYFADVWFNPLPIYAMAVTESVLGANAFAVALPSLLFALGMALGVFAILKQVTDRPALARWLALLSLLAPSVFLYARFGFGASFLPGLLTLSLAALARFEKAPGWRIAVLAGSALGLCAYTYPTGQSLAPLLVAVAAISFAFHAPARRHLPAFLAAAAALGAPMALYMHRFPGRLLSRLKDNSAWKTSSSLGETLHRELHTYYQHTAQVDFLYRTGQHVIWHNAGEGLLPVWIAGPLVLGLGSLWIRRHSPFVRTLAAAMVLSSVPVALTLQQDFPHTSRSLQFVPLAFVAAGLAIYDWLLSPRLRQQRLPRWVPALAIAGALIEGAQDLDIYFTDYAVAQERSMDNDLGMALRMAFDARQGEEPMTLPQEAFDSYRLQFWGDLDPRRIRSVGLEAMGFHHASASPPAPGIVITTGTTPSPAHSTPLGATPADSKGPPAWRVYRVNPAG